MPEYENNTVSPELFKESFLLRKIFEKTKSKGITNTKTQKTRHNQTSLTLGCASHHGVKLHGVHPTTESSSAVSIATGSQADLSSEV